jgi:hypothetical protein
MKKLTSLLLAFALGVFMLAASAPAHAKDQPTSGTWSGTLIDKHCSAKNASDPSGHEKSCVMKCAANGKDLGMIVDGKFYSFDKKGEKLGWNILKKSKAENNVQVTVNGKLAGNKISVSKMMPA